MANEADCYCEQAFNLLCLSLKALALQNDLGQKLKSFNQAALIDHFGLEKPDIEHRCVRAQV